MLSLPPITLRLRSFKLIDRVAGASLLILTLSAMASSQYIPKEKSRADEEDNIREIVLRRLMQEWIRNADKDEAEAKDKDDREIAKTLNFKIFFVEINGKDPSDEFIKRFNLPRTLKKSSASEVDRSPRTHIVDKETHERGIVFSADRVRWLEKDHVKVHGNYYCDALCGADYTFDVRSEKGKWVVRKETTNWVSWFQPVGLRRATDSSC